ncbi:hypothetical protein MOX02_17260 [Methylobacterium oxalidis]|uniref:Uncharacterized protein n=1 Tax=Methylobacterium oxalidis TaxID=944322 RepID=A0A512J133_9HYPH|nr:hypothetical protein MOX02_17260 [Methylobacterium oxalidis]GJE33705.1 hypothetical protein LDDCCGHA_3908 [Methylobacterium oxalidis]GLS62273.1 hypothetical protein GCM10007888_06540 [Methylobacterium oxalidis]
MAGRSRLYKDQRTVEIKLVISEDMRIQLRELALTYGLDASAYVRSLLATHLIRVKASQRDGVL